MMRAVVLLLIACGGPAAPELAYAPVTAHVPQGDRLSLAASLPVDGGSVGALPDGGTQWTMGNGEEQLVAIDAHVGWLVIGQCASGQRDFTMPDAGITIHVFMDGGSCSYAYE